MKNHYSKPPLTSPAALLALAIVIMCIGMRAETDNGTRIAEAKSGAAERTIDFSGFRWWVKKSATGSKLGPGPNFWSDSSKNVWVDDQDRLHLKITRKKDQTGRASWFCAEVVSAKSFGYGNYTWQVDSPIVAQSKTVLGLFTWDDSPESAQFHHREIDVELISTWGETNSPRNAQFCVQPYTRSRNRHRFSITDSTPPTTTHMFNWGESNVFFRSFRGDANKTPETTDIISDWRFAQPGVPPSGEENVRMNLWLTGPINDDAEEPEVIISKFQFKPERPASPAAPKTPEVTILTVPPSSLRPGPVGMGRIVGTASGINPIECKVLVYAYGDRWYVQPMAVNTDAIIGVDGRWTSSTHGGSEYAALLVKAGYKAPATMAVLPSIGGDVLAAVRATPKD
ncbi:MAG: hypothetical protein C5B50_05235 [Verrucomicrobia bacterium]|nr:MAG: hypothetical protein C5B50_05235 [Verrucomicrobiota bacterium]